MFSLRKTIFEEIANNIYKIKVSDSKWFFRFLLQKIFYIGNATHYLRSTNTNDENNSLLQYMILKEQLQQKYHKTSK